MVSRPRVSVIVPTYNRAALLPRALRSVLEQDFADIEVIVIDDGSTDNTPQVVAQFNDERIRYQSLGANRGIGYARYVGVEAARGEFLAMMDSDDVWTPGKLSLQLRAFEQFPNVELTFGDYWNVNLVTGERSFGFTQTQRGLETLEVSQLSTELDFWYILRGMPEAMLIMSFVAFPTIMFSREIITRVGNFNPGLKAAEDLEFVWRCGVMDVSMGYFKRPLLERYKNDSSITISLQKFVPRLDQVFVACAQTAVSHEKVRLLQPIRKARHRLWRSLVHECAIQGQRKESVKFFFHSLTYGFSVELVVYLLAALAGTNAIDNAKYFRNKWRGKA